MRPALRQFLLFKFPPIVWAIIIFTASSFPVPEKVVPEIPFLDKVLHMVEYAVFGLLIFRAFANSNAKFCKAWLIIFSIAIASLYGLSDEIHQAFVPNRNSDLLDFTADTIGAAVGVFIYAFNKTVQRHPV